MAVLLAVLPYKRCSSWWAFVVFQEGLVECYSVRQTKCVRLLLTLYPRFFESTSARLLVETWPLRDEHGTPLV